MISCHRSTGSCEVIIVEWRDLFGRRNPVARFHQRGCVLRADDVHAKLDAFVADEYGRPGDEFAHFMLALAAERAVQRVFAIAGTTLAHLETPTAVSPQILTAAGGGSGKHILGCRCGPTPAPDE